MDKGLTCIHWNVDRTLTSNWILPLGVAQKWRDPFAYSVLDVAGQQRGWNGTEKVTKRQQVLTLAQRVVSAAPPLSVWSSGREWRGEEILHSGQILHTVAGWDRDERLEGFPLPSVSVGSPWDKVSFLALVWGNTFGFPFHVNPLRLCARSL